MSYFVRKKDGNYQCVVSFKQSGKWRSKSKQGFKTVKEAESWGKITDHKIFQDQLDNINTTEMTIKQAIDVFLEYKKDTLKINSIIRYRNDLKVILDDFYDIPVSKVLPINITIKFRALRKKTGLCYTSALCTAKTFFNFCIKYLKLIRENPILEIPKSLNKDTRTKFIDNELYQEIIKNCKRDDRKLFLEIAYNTGMRKSEIQGLKQSDIKDCIITVQRQYQQGKITNDLKTENSYRQIPIPASFYRRIKDYKIMNIEGYIFPRLLDMHHTLKKYNVSMHCFRHTYATKLVSQKINLKICADILGDTLETFINTYVHTDTDERDKVFKMLQNA